jgi:hypothetical protein
MAHMDMDEFFVPMREDSLLPVLKKYDDNPNVIALKPPHFMTAACSATSEGKQYAKAKSQNSSLYLEKFDCISPHNPSQSKIIFKTANAHKIWVHWLREDNSEGAAGDRGQSATEKSLFVEDGSLRMLHFKSATVVTNAFLDEPKPYKDVERWIPAVRKALAERYCTTSSTSISNTHLYSSVKVFSVVGTQTQATRWPFAPRLAFIYREEND